ncbi:MAG: 3-hydroxybutyryl-CoA dehydratase [Chloroflexi bacterium AL-W]|nr:3-hydroxybutyryl-CoA dehydratase [Chloroflexi bacterium AL-N1]NOK70726.1 3-hydroxybutyryl-CoA dehydratase [Chloroflexi bacterium AL-N10]NOK78286.1 3-hydroxybutyryl-CoA dehydratase [Chloroflexi bacterium AL-N5]NOK85629.1 3-hydroxybutyryl-CoA dehydratase [Chloroflexi bacterium AL-W]NOK92543.1 3-hydroxybutyryl-CoA dehydratase [Chloroflexi bacterium AL-N15]
MEQDGVLYDIQNGIGWITLHRPQVHNALSPQVLQRLSTLFDEIQTDSTVKAVVLTGTGDQVFSAGADIRYLQQASPLEVQAFARLAVTVTHKIEHPGKVMVATLNGSALGGGLELAEACMLRLAVPHAQLGHPEVRIGAVVGFGGTTRLPRLIGKGRATELLLTGKLIGADEALQMGLINRVVAKDQLTSTIENLLQEILAQALVAVQLSWDALHRGLNLSVEESALLGADYFGLVATTDDFRIGTSAFVEKTAPSFTGT